MEKNIFFYSQKKYGYGFGYYYIHLVNFMQYLKNIKNIIVSKCRNMYFPCLIVVKICILWCISGPFKLLKFQKKSGPI